MAKGILPQIGDKFGRLTVVGEVHKEPRYKKNGQKDGYTKTVPVCCDCDPLHVFPVGLYKMLSGHTQSCGCLLKERRGQTLKRKVKTGDKFGLLTIVKELDRSIQSDGTKRRNFQVKCDCGNTTEALLILMTTGHKTSCGCKSSQCSIGDRTRTHGMTNSRAYNIYWKMRDRCSNSSDKSYPRYGGRGIKVCDRWMESFENFYADMGDPPKGYSLDRINNNGNYCPENCRWTDRFTQARNKRNNHLITYDGKTQTLTEWAIEKQKKVHTILNRIRNGWTIADALETPVKQYNRQY